MKLCIIKTFLELATHFHIAIWRVMVTEVKHWIQFIYFVRINGDC